MTSSKRNNMSWQPAPVALHSHGSGRLCGLEGGRWDRGISVCGCKVEEEEEEGRECVNVADECVCIRRKEEEQRLHTA